MIAHQAPAYGLTVHFCKNLCLEWGISEREREREDKISYDRVAGNSLFTYLNEQSLHTKLPCTVPVANVYTGIRSSRSSKKLAAW